MQYVEVDQRRLKELLENYLKEVYEYNEKLPKGIRLKVIHYVKSRGKTYLYIGKYFYKYESDGRKVRWKYLGREPPEGVPPPPPNPLEGMSFLIKDGKVLVRKDLYDRYFKSLRAERA
ncbi:MAG: hypothetical protein GXO07_03925 [Crenarchaeota archaeon]|nr:hypothetical protein [Thermoproteota archaeon]